MSKAILVLDEMPKTCFECELCEQTSNDFYCASTGDADGVGDKKPDWCPLKPAPERKLEWFEDDRSLYECGYNACLSELFGEDDDDDD